MSNPTDDQIENILRTAKRVAVVGLSTDPSRPSHEVAKYLAGVGYEIIPVNPKHVGEEFMGKPFVGSLREITGHVDIVQLFRRSIDVPRPGRDAIAIGAGTLWMQLGIRNDEIAIEVRDAGLNVVQDRCMAIEHKRLVMRPD